MAGLIVGGTTSGGLAGSRFTGDMFSIGVAPLSGV